MAEQKKAAEEHKQSELAEQYKKEQEKFENRSFEILWKYFIFVFKQLITMYI